MKHVYRAIPVQIVLLLLLVFLLNGKAIEYEVTGSLVNNKDAPVANHPVLLYNENDEQLAVETTDSEGVFKLFYVMSPTSADPRGWQDGPSEYRLGSSYPNPFNPKTTIPFEAPENTTATIAVYNILGQRVMQTRTEISRGSNEILVTLGGGLSQGQYLLHVQGDGFSETETMTFLSTGISGENSGISVRTSEQPGIHRSFDVGAGEYRLVIEETVEYLGKEITIPANQNFDAGSLVLAKHDDLPVLATKPVTNIASTSAQSGGNITGGNGTEITERGVVWSTSEEPTIDNNEGMTFDGMGIGEYSSNLSGLSSETMYYIRAYAGISGGTFYGDQQSFTTESFEPPDDVETSFDLIDEALAAGDLDEETVLLYKVFATFSDDRLPREYKGDNRWVGKSSIMDDVAEKYWNDELSPEAEEILGTFLVMPIYEGSWWDLQNGVDIDGSLKQQSVPPCSPRRTCNRSEDWKYVGGENVKVWYQIRYEQGDSSLAVEVRGIMENRIWPRLTEYMMKDPVSDEEMRNNGGDGRLDIILDDYVEINAGGKAYPYRGCGGNSNPVYILMDRNLPPVQMAPLLAHEFMHAIHNAFDVTGCLASNAHQWWAESSAVWAETYAWRDHALYDYIRMARWNAFARTFQEKPEKPLYDISNSNYMYGAFLWSVFLERELDEGHIMRIWHHLGRQHEKPPTSLEGIDGFLKLWALGGFEEQWPKFVLTAWNREPYDTFRQWKDYEDGAEIQRDEAFTLSGNMEETIQMATDLEPLSAVYYRFFIHDNKVRSILIANGFTYELDWEEFEGVGGLVRIANTMSDDEREGRSVQILSRYEDKEWDPQPPKSMDFTEYPGTVILRDGSDDKIEEIVMIFANGNMDNSVSASRELSHIEFSNYANYQWEGSLDMSVTDNGVTEKINTQNVVWERVLPDEDTQDVPESMKINVMSDVQPFYLNYQLNYELISGTLNWEISGTRVSENSTCTYSGSENYSIAGAGLPNVLLTAHHQHNDAEVYRSLIYQGYRQDTMPLTGTTTIVCVDSEGETTTTTDETYIPSFMQYSNYLLDELGYRHQVEDNGTVISGNIGDLMGVDDNIQGTWKLEAID